MKNWKDENPITYRKMQISNEIRKLQRSGKGPNNPLIQKLKAEYESLPKPKYPTKKYF